MSSCFKDSQDLSKGFILEHEHKCEQVALLVHGLSDSPYYMKDIAKELYDEGYNVVAVLLSGHGAKAEDLEKITLTDWKKDISKGIRLAYKYGTKITLGGFSTGGALVFNEILKKRKKNKIAKILLFSPVIGIYGPLANNLCEYFPESFTYAMPYVSKKSYGEGVRYQKIATHSLCEVYKLTQEIEENLRSDIEIPLMLSITVEEDSIDIEKALDTLQSYAGKKTIVIYVPLSEKKNWKLKITSKYPMLGKDIQWITHNKKVEHSSILLKKSKYAGSQEINPKFNKFAKILHDFI